MTQSSDPGSTFRPGQRVQFVGVHGDVDGPTGRLWRQTTGGVWVTLSGGRGVRRVCWHPDDVAPVVDHAQGIPVRAAC